MKNAMRYVLGAALGFGFHIYLMWGSGDLMWSAGNYYGVKDAYLFTCGSEDTPWQSDETERIRRGTIIAIPTPWEVAEDVYVKKATLNADPRPLETAEFKAISHAATACRYLRDDALELASKELIKAGDYHAASTLVSCLANIDYYLSCN